MTNCPSKETACFAPTSISARHFEDELSTRLMLPCIGLEEAMVFALARTRSLFLQPLCVDGMLT